MWRETEIFRRNFLLLIISTKKRERRRLEFLRLGWVREGMFLPVQRRFHKENLRMCKIACQSFIGGTFANRESWELLFYSIPIINNSFVMSRLRSTFTSALLVVKNNRTGNDDELLCFFASSSCNSGEWSDIPCLRACWFPRDKSPRSVLLSLEMRREDEILIKPHPCWCIPALKR